MAMYLGEDKVASLGSICNVSGSASKNLFDAYKYSENKTHTGNVSKYNIINPNEIEISYINGWSRLVLTLTGLEPNTDYTISAYLDKSNFNTSVGSGLYALDNYQDSAFTKGSGNVYLTFTSSSTGTFDMWFYGNWSGTNYSGSVIYKNIQLEKGSATEYEKYFEPTISIKDSKGDYHEVPYMTGKVSKNLFDKDNLYVGYNVNSSTGELETNAVYNATNFIKVNGTITVSFSGKIGNYNKIFVGEYDENKNFITRQTNATTTSLQYQFTLNDNTKYIRFSHRNDAGITNVQLEKGSTATEYEKYFEPTISIKDSKGDYHEVPYVTGKVSKNLYPSGLTQVFSAPLIKLTKGTYTITEIDTTSGNWYFGAYKNGSVLSSGVSFSVAFNWSSTTEVWYRADETLKGFTFTLNEDCEVQIGRLNATGTQKVQLEKGSAATEYEEYYEPTLSIRTSNGTFQEVEINKNNYSTAEQVIGTWIDGKPLYRKMVDFGSLPSNAALDIAHNIANVEHMHVNIGETLWCLNSQSYTGQGQIFSPVFTNYISSIYADNTYISVKTIAPDANAFKMLVCLEYTKN